MEFGNAKHRQKGNRADREIVDLHKDIDVHAEHYPLSGSSRFRRSAPGCDSYRSLVSFAAAELALGAAGASDGVLTMTALRDRRWHSDLYDVEGGQHTTSHVVSIRFGRWTNNDARGSSPGMRRGVTLPTPGTIVAAARDEF